MLNTHITTPAVSEAPGSQAKPLFLEFSVDFVKNRYEIVTREFSRMLNTNCTTPMVSKVPGSQDKPPLLEFYVDIVQNRSGIVTWGDFEDALHEYYNAGGI